MVHENQTVGGERRPASPKSKRTCSVMVDCHTQRMVFFLHPSFAVVRRLRGMTSKLRFWSRSLRQQKHTCNCGYQQGSGALRVGACPTITPCPWTRAFNASTAAKEEQAENRRPPWVLRAMLECGWLVGQPCVAYRCD
jgi:hypothetical protein